MTDGTPWLDAEWMQRGLDVLRETLDVNVELKRQMIEFLFDNGFWDRSTLKWEAAISRFNAGMNPEKGVFFKQSEIWALTKKFERYAMFYALADDLGFERPRKKTTPERTQELLERLGEDVQRMNTSFAELSRLNSVGAALRIHPAVREQGASFSLGDEDDAPTIGGF